MPKVKDVQWLVEVKDGSKLIGQVEARAKTPGAACRKAFKSMMRRGTLKKQPPADPEGGFRGTTVVRV